MCQETADDIDLLPKAVRSSRQKADSKGLRPNNSETEGSVHFITRQESHPSEIKMQRLFRKKKVHGIEDLVTDGSD
jgi:hypothetical protein